MYLKEKIENYQPFDDQEIKDKEYFLKWIKDFRDVLTRNNEYAHFTSSAFVVNKDRTKMLVLKHNIYGAFAYPGGHADGEENLLIVAIREVKEETGLIVTPISKEIFAIQALPTKGHVKRGYYISSHTHLDVLYLLEGDDTLSLNVKEDENSEIKWISLENLYSEDIVDWMRSVKEKIVKKLNILGI